MTNKGSRKLNYIATSPPTSQSPRVSTSAHNTKEKSQKREQTQRKSVS